MILRKLQKGDVISLVAPSAGNAELFPHRIAQAKKSFESLGLKVKIEKSALKRDGWVSGSVEERVNDIHSAFADTEVKVIICTIGGNHSNQLLKYLDFELIKNNPKIFIGYSDISVLHYAFLTQSNLQTYYGPCAMTQFGEYPEVLPYTLESFKDVLMSDKTDLDIRASKEWTTEILDWTIKKDLTRSRNMKESEGYTWLRGGAIVAKIIGGCIPSINHLIGTKYWVEPANKIFFIDIPEGHNFGEGLSLHELDAYLTDLDNLGVFEKIKGLIIGRPYNYSDSDIEGLKELIMKYTKNKDYPILFNVNIGHADPIITLPLMSVVELDSKKNIFRIKIA